MRKHTEIQYCRHCKANTVFTWNLDVEGEQEAQCNICGTPHYRVIDADLRTRIMDARANV
jgi:uncharacterized paraquat-inducible protein A